MPRISDAQGHEVKLNSDSQNSLPVSVVGSLPNDGITPGNGNIAQTPVLFNESTWDRQRGNTQDLLLASAARTATVFTPNIVNYNAKGIILFLNITAASGTGGLGIGIITVDPVSGQTLQLNASTTKITATGIYGYVLYPGASAPGVAGAYSVQQFTPAPLGRAFTVQVQAGDGTSYTYSLGYTLIV